MLISTLESGLSAMAAICLRFSNGRVYDLFLYDNEKSHLAVDELVCLLHEVEDRDAVSDWA